MDTGLRGKKVMITGSTSGIGRGIAEAFAREGARVVVNGSSAERVERAVAELKAQFPEAAVSGVAADLSLAKEAERLYGEAVRDGPLDILVNNVGIYPVKRFEEITDDDWFEIWNMNVMSTVRLCRRALPDMLRANSGKIININSEAGLRPNGDLVHYSATKSALLGFSRAIAELTKGSRVTVNSVLPVTTWTPGIENYLRSLAERKGIDLEQAKIDYFRSGNDSTSLLQRFLTVEEVAKTVIFAACNDGVNGNSILIDAGVIRHI